MPQTTSEKLEYLNNTKSLIKDSLEDMTRNCISSIINNPKKLKNLLEKIYTCLCCGRKTSINDSGSIRGAYLVCGWCAYDKFDGWYGLRKWQCKMIREELEDD